jgi:hypothetical protein
VNVKDYQAQLTWFEEAYKIHGRIDMAVYSAGVTESMGWIVSADTTLESVKEVIYPVLSHFILLCLPSTTFVLTC